MDPIALDQVPDEARRRRQMFARSSGTRFDVRAVSDGVGAEVELYDEIGFWGVTAKDFKARLKEIGPGDLTLKINSPGGDVFDGIAMFNELIAHEGRVRVEVTGLAASAASVVAMAGDEIVMADNAFLMIHNAWAVVIGNRHDMRDFAATLDKIDGALAKTYAIRSGRGVRTVAKMMDDETWMTADEAVETGFADAKYPRKDDAKASFDLSVFAAVPDALKRAPVDVVAETIRDAERLLMRDAGYSRSQARAVLAAARTPATSAMQDAGGAAVVRALNDFAARLSPNRR